MCLNVTKIEGEIKEMHHRQRPHKRESNIPIQKERHKLSSHRMVEVQEPARQATFRITYS